MTTEDQKRLFAAIHGARRKIAGLEDEAAWRAFLARAMNGKNSLRAMDDLELGHVLDLLNAGAGARPPKVEGRPVAQKARALWLSLYNLGLVASSHDRALSAFVKRQTGIDDVAWLTADQADTVLEALKGMCQRGGYVPERYHWDSPIPASLEGSFKPGLIEAQWRRLIERGAFKTGELARLDTWLRTRGYGVAAPQFLTEAQANDAIRQLGAWIRRLAKERAS